MSYNPQRAGKTMELEKGKPDWPELPPDEEFLRIVLLESRVMGKDITVEPYKNWNDELAWRRTYKYVMLVDKKRMMSVEQVYALQDTLTRMNQAFSNQKGELATRVRKYLCTHKNADSADATVGVPVSGERWCDACGAQFD